MTKFLNGSELVGYIKERQAREVRALRQASRVAPRLVIIKSKNASSVIETYVRMKQRYSDDILIDTVVETLSEDDMPKVIAKYNVDNTVHGIIVQLPLDDAPRTDEIVNMIAPDKDVDGLGTNANFESATAKAVNWLLAGYAIELRGKKIAIVGEGRLVGRPLAKLWQESGYNVTVLNSTNESINEIIRASQVVVSATGVPHLIKSDMVGIGATVVDAGTASENGVILGDVDQSVRERDDLTITPEKGGVGPMTIASLFDNVIVAAKKLANTSAN